MSESPPADSPPAEQSAGEHAVAKRLDLEFLYVGDPMCSWCWGFAPALEKLQATYAVPMTTIVGGLAPGGARGALGPSARATIMDHWHHVTEASGQPFDFDALDSFGDEWVYDTEPGCRSVVAMRRLSPTQEFAWFARLQRAFYAEAIDITDVGRHLPLLDEYGIDRDSFSGVYNDDATARATHDDFGMAQAWGITGFPSLMVRVGEQVVMVTQGWVAWDHLETQLTRWFTRQFPDDVADLVG